METALTTGRRLAATARCVSYQVCTSTWRRSPSTMHSTQTLNRAVRASSTLEMVKVVARIRSRASILHMCTTAARSVTMDRWTCPCRATDVGRSSSVSYLAPSRMTSVSCSKAVTRSTGSCRRVGLSTPSRASGSTAWWAHGRRTISSSCRMALDTDYLHRSLWPISWGAPSPVSWTPTRATGTSSPWASLRVVAVAAVGAVTVVVVDGGLSRRGGPGSACPSTGSVMDRVTSGVCRGAAVTNSRARCRDRIVSSGACASTPSASSAGIGARRVAANSTVRAAVARCAGANMARSIPSASVASNSVLYYYLVALTCVWCLWTTIGSPLFSTCVYSRGGRAIVVLVAIIFWIVVCGWLLHFL